MIRLEPRVGAIRDVEAAVDWYATEAGEGVAARFVASLEAAYGVITDRPEIGSTAQGIALGIPELRSWRVRGFPFVVFYEFKAGTVEVWRILHAQRDIPAELSLSGPEEDAPDDA